MKRKEKKRSIEPGGLVWVQWVDSIGTADGWRRLREMDWDFLKTSNPHETVGFVMNNLDGFLVVAQNIRFSDQACNGYIAIPWGCILKVRKMKKPK